MRRTDNYNLTEFDAVCFEDGQFPEQLDWPSCANGDYCGNDVGGLWMTSFIRMIKFSLNEGSLYSSDTMHGADGIGAQR